MDNDTKVEYCEYFKHFNVNNNSISSIEWYKMIKNCVIIK